MSHLRARIQVGNPVTGGGANRILYQDASANLATTANFTYDGAKVDITTSGVNATALRLSNPLSSSGDEHRIDFRETAFGTTTARIANFFSSAGGTNFGLKFYTGTGTLNATPALTLDGLTNGAAFGGPISMSLGLTVDNSASPVLAARYQGSAGHATTLKLQWGVFPTGGPSAAGDENRVDFYESFGSLSGRIANFYSTTPTTNFGIKFYTYNPGVGLHTVPALILHGTNMVETQKDLRIAYSSSYHCTIAVDSGGNTAVDIVTGGGTPELRLNTVTRFNANGGATYLPYTDGYHYLSADNIYFRTAGNTTKITFANSGNLVTLTDAINIAVGTTTGTKIGTATSQKLGFWNVTPIVQPTTSIGAATFTQNSGNAVNDASTFDGYTLGQVVQALRNMGVLA